MADGAIGAGVEVAKELNNVSESIEGLAKEYTKSLEKLNKVSGGFGIGLTKFGTLNAKLDLLADRIDLNTKQNKSLLAFETTFAKVLNSNNQDIQRLQEQYGPKILSDTLLDAFSAGGPILADALDLGAMMTAVGKDPAKMFKFLNEFKSITGFGIKEQRMLVTSLKNNFSRQDALIDALESLTSTLQQAAQISPELPKNITTLVDQIAQSFPGLEKQFADLFKKFLADPTISRGYLGPELANANRDMVQKLLANQATKDDILSFIEKITNSPEVKAREELFKKQALQTGLLPDSLTALTTMLGEFVAEARQTNSAVATFTDQMSSSDLIAKDKLASDKLLPNILKQLDITLEKVNRTITLSTEDLALLQKTLGNLIPGFPQMSSEILDQTQKSVDTLAQSVNDLTVDQVKTLRNQEEKISQLYTTYRQVKDTASTAVEVGDSVKKAYEAIKDLSKKERGADCANAMYVRICSDDGGDGSGGGGGKGGGGKGGGGKGGGGTGGGTPWWKKSLDYLKSGWGWFKLVVLGGIVGLFKNHIIPAYRDFKRIFTMNPINWWKSATVGGKIFLAAVIGALVAAVQAIIELGGTAAKESQSYMPKPGIEEYENNKRIYEQILTQMKAYTDNQDTNTPQEIPEEYINLKKQLEEILQAPSTRGKFDEYLKNKNINKAYVAPPLPDEQYKEMGETISRAIQQRLQDFNHVMPEGHPVLVALKELKTEVAKVSSTIIDTKTVERYNGVTESA